MKKVRKSITALMLAIAVVFTVIPAVASAKTVQEQSVFVNGVKVKYAQAPLTINGTTMVSARETIEAFGLGFTWDKANKRVIGSNGEMTVTLVLGQYTGVVNGVSVFLGSPAVERGGRIMVPLRFLVDSMGASMETKNGRISIKDNSKSKSKYNTGLPLQITNTYVKNLSKSTVVVHYVNYFFNDGELVSERYSMSVAKGKKGVFDSAALATGDYATDYYGEPVFFGRTVEFVEINGEEIESNSFGFAEDSYYADSFTDSMLEMYKRQLAELKKELKAELVKNKNIPLKVNDWSIGRDDYGSSEVTLYLKNLTEKTVVGFDVSFSCFDAKGNKVNYPFTSSNRFTGLTKSQFKMESGDYYWFKWSLSMFPNTTKISNITIDRVVYSDGTVWKRK
ncbi:hypothetical protein EBB07_20990 [Paenibacillaceae bacterium]|nr:hypothetical protein EBB07_20990 [Paenibacillaceae bacterium]